MNIFVTHINYKTSRDTLKNAFSKYGNVTSVRIIRDRETRRSKGFGFVEMSTDAEAQEAISQLNETELDGRIIIVKPANPRPEKKNSPSNSPNQNTDSPDPQSSTSKP